MATIAAFAPDVIALADADDADAKIIVSYAARSLARSVRVGAARLERPAGVLLRPAACSRPARCCSPRCARSSSATACELRPPLGDPLDGAARLLERPARFASLIEEVR